ncbi:MAG: copper homeostasis protein CutC, partial [Spirillospora sp.]
MSLLEIIALTADDARAAQDGGADRLEVVADMAADGLTPDPELVAAVRRATTLPIRVMLRANA